MQPRVRTQWHTLWLCPHTASVSLAGPSRRTAFAYLPSGKHKDSICLWQKSTPTFLSYMLTGVLHAPSPNPTHFTLTPKPWPTLLCKKIQYFFSYTGGGETQIDASWTKFSALLNVLLVKLNSMHMDVGLLGTQPLFELVHISHIFPAV